MDGEDKLKKKSCNLTRKQWKVYSPLNSVGSIYKKKKMLQFAADVIFPSPHSRIFSSSRGKLCIKLACVNVSPEYLCVVDFCAHFCFLPARSLATVSFYFWCACRMTHFRARGLQSVHWTLSCPSLRSPFFLQFQRHDGIKILEIIFY